MNKYAYKEDVYLFPPNCAESGFHVLAQDSPVKGCRFFGCYWDSDSMKWRLPATTGNEDGQAEAGRGNYYSVELIECGWEYVEAGRLF